MKKVINSLSPSSPTTKGVFSGYASFFDIIDQKRDQIAKGAFTKTLKAWQILGKKPKMLWQHEPKEPIGQWTSLQQDEKGLYVEGRLSLDLPRAKEAYILLKEGILDGLSIGFRTVESVYDQERKTRILLDIDLIEISLVTFGANSKATVHHIKAI
ncbi:MAG: HK97 family phage prohead protease [Alphaproteobacteria bacterium]|nr:HK97 family phage prohead protease [Alphaproteobacteria bacterium]